jgi:hypothetical protein
MEELIKLKVYSVGTTGRQAKYLIGTTWFLPTMPSSQPTDTMAVAPRVQWYSMPRLNCPFALDVELMYRRKDTMVVQINTVQVVMAAMFETTMGPVLVEDVVVLVVTQLDVALMVLVLVVVLSAQEVALELQI